MGSTDLRAAAQQALEALTPFFRGYWTPGLAVQAAAAMDRLKAALAEPDTCTWQQDGDNTSGAYGTSCRHYFHLEDGTPEDNRMKWCCYCGKRLAQSLITEDEDD